MSRLSILIAMLLIFMVKTNSGLSQEPTESKPSVEDLGIIFAGEELERTVHFASPFDKDFIVKDIEVTSLCTGVSLKPGDIIAANSERDLVVKINPPKPSDLLAKPLGIEVRVIGKIGDETKTLAFQFKGVVRPLVYAYLGHPFLSINTRNGKYYRNEFNVTIPERLKPLKAESLTEGFTVVLDELTAKPSLIYKVLITADNQTLRQQRPEKLHIRFSSGDTVLEESQLLVQYPTLFRLATPLPWRLPQGTVTHSSTVVLSPQMREMKIEPKATIHLADGAADIHVKVHSLNNSEQYIRLEFDMSQIELSQFVSVPGSVVLEMGEDAETVTIPFTVF